MQSCWWVGKWLPNSHHSLFMFWYLKMWCDAFKGFLSFLWTFLMWVWLRNALTFCFCLVYFEVLSFYFGCFYNTNTGFLQLQRLFYKNMNKTLPFHRSLKFTKRKHSLEKCLFFWLKVIEKKVKHVYKLVSSHVWSTFCHVEFREEQVHGAGGSRSSLCGFKCISDICLRTCRGHSSHWSDVSVCRGVSPHPRVTVRTFSHLSTCEILHTSHNWSMTVSANCIRCFFYMLFTQIIWIIVLVGFGASFFNVIAPKLVVQVVVFFFLIFLVLC